MCPQLVNQFSIGSQIYFFFQLNLKESQLFLTGFSRLQIIIKKSSIKGQVIFEIMYFHFIIDAL